MIIGKSAARSSRRNVGDRPKTMCRQELRNEVPKADRKAERPASHLEDFKGVLHVDGYAGFERLTGKGDVALAACWAYTRRKFCEVAGAIGSPVAAEVLRRVGGLYVIEAREGGQSSAHRLAERRSFSRPIVQALHAWLEAQLPRVAGRSTLAVIE